MFLLCLTPGCVTPWERSALLKDDRAEIGSVQGPTERGLQGWLWNKRKQDALDDENALLKPIEGMEDYQAAEELYNNEDYADAEKAFKKIAKNKKYKRSEIREDALFMQAEAAYEQEKYAAAYDHYSELIRDYPTTRHLDEISKRLFKIGMVWLDHPQVAEMGEIQQVNYDRYGERLPPEEPPQLPNHYVFVPNFSDKKRPLFDTQGNAITALKSIWTNDPTGPLADDALMLAASYYARKGDFIEADRHFTMLREQFPDSPHVEKAFELGAHVKLMSYQGSSYDGKALNDSEQLKLATMRLFPDTESKERIEAEIQKIELAKADRLWRLVVYFEGKRRKKAAATYCHLLISRYPDSPYVDRCWKKLEEFGPGYADGRALANPYPDPPRTLYTSVFPADDHGGVPVPPPLPPGAKPQKPEKYGAQFALIKPERVKNKQKSVAVEPPESSPSDSEIAEEDAPKPKRRLIPRLLPNSIDRDSKPAPVGQSRLEDENSDSEDLEDDEIIDTASNPEEDDGLGHSQPR